MLGMEWSYVVCFPYGPMGESPFWGIFSQLLKQIQASTSNPVLVNSWATAALHMDVPALGGSQESVRCTALHWSELAIQICLASLVCQKPGIYRTGRLPDSETHASPRIFFVLSLSLSLSLPLYCIWTALKKPYSKI